MTQSIHTINDFKEALRVAGGKRVILDCGASWCGPCRAIAPMFDDLAIEYAAISVGLKMDVDDAPELADLLQVTSMPTFFVFQDGEVIQRFSGANAQTLRHAFSQQATHASHPMHSFQLL